MVLHNALVTGSLTLNGTDISNITGSSTYSASFASQLTSLNTYTGSNNTNISALHAFSSSILTYTASNDLTNATQSNRLSTLEVTTGSLNTASGSAITRLNALETTTGSLNTASGSAITRLGSLETASGSAITRLNSIESNTGSYATTGSNTFVSTQYISCTSNPTGFTTAASLYTDGGLRVTKDAYVSGTLYLNNVTIYGTQSVNYITSSQLDISDNIINVNTATPNVRFGGLAVYDSGSTGLTGSILWDSQNNNWVYSNPSGSGNYDSSMVIMGPRNNGSLGNEQGLNCNYLVQGHGSHHTTSSMIFHDGTNTCIPNTLAGGISCFSTSCAASFIGGTMSGTTIYGSTAVCSPVGKFTTCLDLGGALTGTSATFSMPSGNGALTIANSCLSGKNWTLLPNTNGAESDLLLYYAGASAGTRLTIASTGAATFISSLGYGAGFGLFPRGQGVTDWYLGRYISSPETIDNAIGSLGGNAWRIGYTLGSSFVPTISLFAGGSATFSSIIQNVSGIYVRASGNSDLPFINFSNADGVYNWGRVGGLLQGDGDGSLYFQTKLGGSLGTRLTITSTGASTFACTIQANGGNITSFSSVGAAAFGNGINIHTQPGTYTAGHGGILQFQNEDVITGGIRAIRDGGSWGGALLFYTHNTSAGNTFDTTFVERMRITSDGNVLIGTGTTPEGPLDVYKSNSAGLGGHIILRNNGSAVANETAVLFVDGGVGTTRAAISSTTENSPYFGDLKFKTGLGTYACLTTRMTIAGSTGYVGISVTSACKNLEVGGTIRTTVSPSVFYRDMSYIGDIYQFGPGETTDNVDFKICGGSTWATGGNFRWFTQTGNGTPSERMRISSAGVVTVTNASSDAQLSLSSGGTTAYVKFTNCAGDTWGIGNSFSAANTDFQLYNFTTSAYGFRVSRGGIYANTTATAANVQIDSNGYFARSTASSRRFKENITDWNSNGLNTILALKPKIFKYKEDYYNKANVDFLGLIAEEVAEVSPYLADYENEDRTGQVENVRYANIVVPLIKAVQEQQCTICSQASMINTLKTCLGIA